MKSHYKFNSRTSVIWLTLLGVLLLGCSWFTFVHNPLHMIMKKTLKLKQGNIFFKLWSNPPYEVLIKVHIFNVTNSEQFLSGEDPKLNFTEVGPYYYKEILTNENATFHSDGTITFYPRRKIVLDRVRSVGDPLVDRIVSPNIPLLGIQAFLNDASIFTNFGFSSLVATLGSPSFLNITIDEYLWGYEDRLVELANEFIPSWIDFDKFGILDRLLSVDNGNTVKISTFPELDPHPHEFLSEEDKMRPYHIVEWNGSPGLRHWGWVDPVDNETVPDNKPCQLIAGAFEGTILPSFMPENTTIKIFRNAFCRPVPLVYSGRGKSNQGFDAYNFRISSDFLATPEENPENACYCVKGRCLPKGLGHLSPCYYGIPITMSPPHFLNSDPMLLEQVNGLKPDVELHDSIAQVHPILGVPLEGHLRLQINLDVGQTRLNSRTRPFNGLHVPLFWLELTTGEFPDIVYQIINWTCHILPVVQLVIVYMLGILGVSLISTAALVVLFYSTQQKINSRVSLRSEYCAIPTVLTMNSDCFKGTR